MLIYIYIYLDGSMIEIDSKEDHKEEEVWVEEDPEACDYFVSRNSVQPVTV